MLDYLRRRQHRTLGKRFPDRRPSALAELVSRGHDNGRLGLSFDAVESRMKIRRTIASAGVSGHDIAAPVGRLPQFPRPAFKSVTETPPEPSPERKTLGETLLRARYDRGCMRSRGWTAHLA